MSDQSSNATLRTADSPRSILSVSTLVEDRKKTGRPKEWTEKRLRKFSRLYSYSELPMKDIPAALREKDWAPRKDAMAKHSQTLFGTDPRWLQLRPKNRDVMDKRINRLTGCHKAGRTIERDLRTSAERSIKQHHTLQPGGFSTWTERPLDDLLTQESSGPFTSTFYSATDTYNPAIDHPPVVTLGDNALQDAQGKPIQPAIPTNQGRRLGALKLFPSTKGASKAPSIPPSAPSTHISTSSIQRRLPQYSTRYLKKIVRLLDTHSVDETSAAAITITQAYTSTARSENGSLDDDDSSITLIGEGTRSIESTAGAFPDTFLVLDQCVKHQGICITGLKPHDNKSCWCAVIEELGPSGADFWSLNSLGDDFDIHLRDEFDNSILHLLAARGASWDLILDIIKLGANVNAKNVAGRNFLQVLDSTALRCLAKDLCLERCTSLIHELRYLNFEFDHCDFFGRSFLHNISRHFVLVCKPSIFLGIELPSTRDAFGWIPKTPDNWPKRGQVTTGDVMQIACLFSPSYGSAVGVDWPFGVPDQTLELIPTVSQRGVNLRILASLRVSTPITKQHSAISGVPLEDGDLWKHARLIETARLASNAPWLEEVEGRNGLQCLAEAILDIHIENDKVVRSMTCKRKRGQSTITTASMRLQLRYELVQDLVTKGVDLNHYDSHGSTVLMAFIAHLPDGEDDKILAKILVHLIRNGANIHWRNRQGETALHIAIRLGRKVATRVLLDHGANVHARTTEGKGILLVGESHYFKARDDPPLYASIMVCMALAIDYRAVPSPTLVQEWSSPN